ncbi:hypothetical protein N8482_02005 [Chitinophagales bacterium]|nr:hypothetical protein [Chitinophagales bacterium]
MKGLMQAAIPRQAAEFQIRCSDLLPLAGEWVQQLEELGFPAKISSPESIEQRAASDCKAIWIGEDIPSRVAIKVLKFIARRGDVSYVQLSCDEGFPADEDANRIVIGGSSFLSQEYFRLLPWSPAEIESLDESMETGPFRSLIRSKYDPD